MKIAFQSTTKDTGEKVPGKPFESYLHGYHFRWNNNNVRKRGHLTLFQTFDRTSANHDGRTPFKIHFGYRCCPAADRVSQKQYQFDPEKIKMYTRLGEFRQYVQETR